jgi:hypothetical protein
VAPILLSIRSAGQFDTAAYWLERNNRPIMIVVSFLVGGFFLWSGAVGLLG